MQNGIPIFLQNFIPISCLLNAISTFFSKCNFNLFLQNVVPIFFCKVSILSFFAKCHSYLLLAKCNFYLFLQNVIPTFFCKMAFLSFCLKLFQYFLQIVLPIFFLCKIMESSSWQHLLIPFLHLTKTKVS